MSARNAIENTLSRYAWGFCMHDVEMLADCFSEQAEVVFPDGYSASNREEAMGWLTGRQGEHKPIWILTSNVLILEESADEARVNTVFTSLGGEKGAVTVGSIGYYEDTFVNEEGTWRIRRRHVHPGAGPGAR
jgi:hypothetical protein